MMMPANFSAISENEMTYVNGGAIALENILAPTLKVEDWQRFNKNMVTLIGNKFAPMYVGNTLGVLFSGKYVPGNMARASYGTLKGVFDDAQDSYLEHTNIENAKFADFMAGANGALNAGLNIVGSAAAIYNLATGTVKNAVEGLSF